MSPDDRRVEPRQPSEAPAYLMWHEGETVRSARGRLLDSSTSGLRFRTAARLRPGAIVYCAVPAHCICSRVQIRHARRELFRTDAGGPILATF